MINRCCSQLAGLGDCWRWIEEHAGNYFGLESRSLAPAQYSWSLRRQEGAGVHHIPTVSSSTLWLHSSGCELAAILGLFEAAHIYLGVSQSAGGERVNAPIGLMFKSEVKAIPPPFTHTQTHTLTPDPSPYSYRPDIQTTLLLKCKHMHLPTHVYTDWKNICLSLKHSKSPEDIKSHWYVPPIAAEASHTHWKVTFIPLWGPLCFSSFLWLPSQIS